MAGGPRTISIITPVVPERAGFLPAAWASICSQALPAGWRFEWIVQIDGPAVALELPTDDRIHIDANGNHWGAATTRTLALFRSTGEWVAPLDADDVLAPGSLHAAVVAIEASPEARWVAGPWGDCREDGTPEDRDHSLGLPTGPLPAGWFLDYLDRYGRSPWLGAAGVLHADSLRAAGGWAALPRAEDLAPWCVIAGCFPGVYIDRLLGYYRKWGGQTTATPAFEVDRRWVDAVRAQASALARLGGLPPPVSI